MTNLDKVYNTWKNIEHTYKVNSKGLTRREFMVKMIGGDSSLIQLRKMIMKDFSNNDEDLMKMNELFEVLDSAKSRLESCDEIEDLDVFVWNTDDRFGLGNLEIGVDGYTLASKLLNRGLTSSYFSLDNGKVSSFILDPLSEDLVEITSVEEVRSWIGMRDSKFKMLGNFQQKVFLYLLLHSRELSKFPIVFVRHRVLPISNWEKSESTVSFRGEEYSFSSGLGCVDLNSCRMEVIAIE